MFHSARALLYSKGYREKSHYYLLVAMHALFVKNKLGTSKNPRLSLRVTNGSEAIPYNPLNLGDRHVDLRPPRDDSLGQKEVFRGAQTII